MRRQILSFYADEQLAAVYPRMYDHTQWPDHRMRVARTIEVATAFGRDKHWESGIDLSCGDGAILGGLRDNGTVQRAYFGDLVFAPHLDVIGKIENTLPGHIRPLGSSWDLFICSETIEHVADPDLLLRRARALADHVVLTTPIDEDPAVHANPEHYWSWGLDDIREMAELAGFEATACDVLPGPFYNFQIWSLS